MRTRVVPRCIFGVCAFTLIPSGWGQQVYQNHILGPKVPTPPEVVHRMLELGEVSAKDIVYDLGSGDGRILFTAAQEFGARAVGIEIDANLVEKTRTEIKKLGLERQVEVRHANLLEADLSEASVVTIYLLRSADEDVRPGLERDLKPGARVITHDLPISRWVPLREEEFRQKSRTHRIYVYEVGKHLE